MNLNDAIFHHLKKILKADQRNVLHLFYYSIIDAVLVLSVPMASAIVINSVLAHATLSIVVLGVIILVLFLFITALQLLKEYIIEKFQQTLFVKTGIEVGTKALLAKEAQRDDTQHAKLMNYFFDITSIQKFFPILLLDGWGIMVQIVVSLLLLLAFNPILFGAGLLFFTGYIFILILLGNQAIARALQRSDAKHNAIYFLQHIHENTQAHEEIYVQLDEKLSLYAKARQKLFRVLFRQLGFTFFAEGFIFSMFLMLGGSLVIAGHLPLGEFVAAEIIVTSITYALKSFAKHLDYLYDMIEGLHKVHKLSTSLEPHHG